MLNSSTLSMITSGSSWGCLMLRPSLSEKKYQVRHSLTSSLEGATNGHCLFLSQRLFLGTSAFHLPLILLRSFFFLVGVSEFCDEVYQYLGFDFCLRSIFDVELAQFNCPLNESSYCIYLVRRLSYWLVCHDNDEVCLGVRMEFPGSDHQCESYLFHPWVICLYSLECLTSIVSSSLINVELTIMLDTTK